MRNLDLFIPHNTKTWHNLRDEDDRRGIVLRSDIIRLYNNTRKSNMIRRDGKKYHGVILEELRTNKKNTTVLVS